MLQEMNLSKPIRKTVCCLMSAALLATAAMAAPGSEPSGDTPAVEAPQQQLLPLRLHGQAKEIGEDRILLETDGQQTYPQVILTITDQTLILDAVTGAKVPLADLKANDSLYAFASPAMTRSMPPMSAAYVVFCNIPADFAVPNYVEIEAVEPGEDGAMTLVTNQSLLLHVNKETELLALEGAEPRALSDLKPGDRVIAWYQVVALSEPAQATPSKLMTLGAPEDEEAQKPTLSATEEQVSVNGEALALAAAEQPYTQGGEVMVPLRRVAEALGCQVSWDAAGRKVTVSKDGEALYTVPIDSGSAQVSAGALVQLAQPSAIHNGVTFLASGDLAALHSAELVK